jgi:betaine-aldehyde dehydrogenase
MNALEAFRKLSGHQRISGRIVESAGNAVIDVTDPATEQRLGHIADANPSEIDEAVQTANAAQRSWRSVNHHRRAELLHEVSRRVMADRTLVAEMLTREMGKPYKESFDEVAWSASAIDYYAEIARHENGKVLGSAVDGQFHFNPLTYDSATLYPYVTASLPAAGAAALTYFLGSLCVIRAGRGGYRAT